MASLSQFSTRIGQIAATIPEEADKTVRRAALAADQAVVMATPVDTGRARSNWIAGLDAPAGEARTAYAPGKEGSTSGPNTQAALDQASEAIAGYDGEVNSEVHLTNNLPYIGVLNDGSSAQAPAGFVQSAVQAGTAVVKAARFLANVD